MKDATCIVRINGDTVLEYDRLELSGPGPIAVQAHGPGHWTEYKQVRARRI